MGFEITEITIAHEKTPLGMDIKNPTIAWKFAADGENMKQRSARILVGTTDGGGDMWDSGVMTTDRSIGIKYGGKPLRPCTRYFARVEVTAENGSAASADTFFETGFLDGSMAAWDGAEWIGAPEYYVRSDALGIFSIESNITVSENGVAGIIFGANDARLTDPNLNEKQLCGENYIRYEISLKSKALNIYRVGYDENDSADKPFAEVPVSAPKADEPFSLKIEVTGNCAAAYINGAKIDARQLNPLGGNDVPTYPRLCDVGYYVKSGTTASFDGLKMAFLRKPSNEFRRLDPEGIRLTAKNEDIRIVKSPDCHSLPMLRRSFTVKKPMERARLYVTARGIYDCRINGKPVTDSYFNPGASQFDKHIMYQTYDITDLITQGKNGIGFTLASGWWNGSQTFTLMNYNYWGDKESVLAKIVITYSDKSADTFVTNTDDWQYYGEGPYLFAGFFQGERFDAERAWIYEDFSKADFSIEGMKKPSVIKPVPIPEFDSLPGFFLPWAAVNYTEPEIIGSFNAPIRSVEEFTAVSVISPSEGVYIYDMGQETAGVPHLRLKGKKGAKVRIRYGEMLYPEMYGKNAGRLLQENLRDAAGTDVYILRGDEEGEEYSPKFTFHGYRYIEISGLGYAPALDDVKSLQLSSVKAITGEIVTDNELLNRFIKNVRYSQLCNFISIPTDCPQRNERMGWIGDAHVFAKTAVYQADVRTFFLRYLQAIRDVQLPDGNIPNIAPVGGGFGGITYAVGIHLIVWEIYRQYGDAEVIEENYDAMKRCVQYFERIGMPGNVNVGPIDDWLAPAHTDSSLVWNAFYGRAVRLMERFAGILGKKADEQYYRVSADNAQKYWNDTFVDNRSGKTLCADGSENDTQGSYSIGLGFDMFDDKYRERAFEHLARTSRQAGYTVTTGFFGTGFINPMLSEGGYPEDAYKMMTSTSFPSWLFPVTQGATTIWEHWDSYTEENGFGEYNCMNSFNHYSFGAVVGWLYEYVLGIRRDESRAGCGHFTLKPELSGFKSVKGGFESLYGRIESGYDISEGTVTYCCTIPPNTTAELILPGFQKILGSGRYTFKVKI